MAIDQPGFSIGFMEAAASMLLKQYYCVKVTADKTFNLCTAAGESFLGILQDKPDTNEVGNIMRDGVSKVVAGVGGLTAGQQWMTASNGTAIAATSGKVAAGTVLMGATVGLLASVTVGKQDGTGTEDTISGVVGSRIYVDTGGNDTYGDGTILSPVATLTKALTLCTTTRKEIVMGSGVYAEVASITWPNVTGIVVRSNGGNVVVSGPITTPVITINPTFTTATFEASLGVCIEHTAQVGLEIDNAGMGTRKLIVYLDDFSASQVSTGDSVHVTHTTAGQAIRIYAKGCDEIEGLVNVVTTTADDRFRFTAGCALSGGLTVTGAIASEVTILNSQVLTGALTVNATNVLTYRGSVYRTDAGVYTELADTYSS